MWNGIIASNIQSYFPIKENASICLIYSKKSRFVVLRIPYLARVSDDRRVQIINI